MNLGGRANGWLCFVDECHQRSRRQRQGGGDMLWAGTIGDKLAGSVRVPEELKDNGARLLQSPEGGL